MIAKLVLNPSNPLIAHQCDLLIHIWYNLLIDVMNANKAFLTL